MCILSLYGLLYFYHSFSFLRTFSHFSFLPQAYRNICFSYLDFPGILYLFGYFNHKSLLFKMCLLLSLRCVIFSMCVCMYVWYKDICIFVFIYVSCLPQLLHYFLRQSLTSLEVCDFIFIRPTCPQLLRIGLFLLPSIGANRIWLVSISWVTEFSNHVWILFVSWGSKCSLLCLQSKPCTK